jgi:hypothetical protein
MTFRSLAIFLSLAAHAETFAGRWAMEATGQAKKVFWLEVTGESPVAGQFFGVTGGRLETLRDAKIEGDALHFRVERTLDTGRKMEGSVALRRKGEGLEGSVTTPARTFAVRGWRSPAIPDRDDGSWKESTPRALLTPDFAAWREYPERVREWRFENGILRNLTEAAKLLVTRDDYWNFRLRLEYKLPKNGNAGIGLRHHYELQLADDYGQPPSVHGNVSLYSQIAPSANASKPPGEWQTLEATLIGRDLTVVLNGRRVIDRQPIRGLTGLALDADETEPGPISLQGDHGVVEYRNVTIARLSK